MIRLGTRGSALALAQARSVAERLAGEVELVPIATAGERAAAGGDKSRFVRELEEALLDGRIDLAVHSAKDVPGELPEGLAIVSVPERADARDALCGAGSLDRLAAGSVVGTGSVRRRAQLLALRPDLEVRELRGNVDTRLRRLAEGDFDAIVLARAGLERLGRAAEGTPLDELVPAPGQGCLALEARRDDARQDDPMPGAGRADARQGDAAPEARRDDARQGEPAPDVRRDGPRAGAAPPDPSEVGRAASALTDRTALTALTAERALVARLDASCHTPIGAHATFADGGNLRLVAFVGLPDGSHWIRDELDGDARDPAALGQAVAERLELAGARELLAEAERVAVAD